ncbi:hypothetical protein, partial [Pseudomonas sp. Xaverov 83]
LRFSKVSRCKSGTISGRYLNNGYDPDQANAQDISPHPARLSGYPPCTPQKAKLTVYPLLDMLSE